MVVRQKGQMSTTVLQAQLGSSSLDVMEHRHAGAPSCHPSAIREIGRSKQSNQMAGVGLRMVPAGLMDHGGQRKKGCLRRVSAVYG